MIRPKSLRLAALVVLTLAGLPPFASAQGVGIKVGPTFDEFSGDVLNFDNRTGIHAGLFIGGSRDKVVEETITNPATGSYQLLLAPDQSGMHSYRAEGTTGTTVAVVEGQFSVLTSVFA